MPHAPPEARGCCSAGGSSPELFEHPTRSYIPMTKRQVGRVILSLSAYDARVRRLMTEHMWPLSKALRILKQGEAMRQTPDGRRNVLWQRS